MSKAPKVSIVTVTYNHESYIRQTLDSFIMQKVSFDFEVIVADDHSSDKTPKIIKEYAEKYPQIIKPILRQKNIGMQKNFIDVLQAARGDYIALCEGDDYWTDSEKLQIEADFLDKNPEHALCFHPVSVFFDDGSKEDSIWPVITDKSTINLEQLLAENFIPTNSVMYRRQDYSHLADDVMPFDWYLHAYHLQFGKIGYIDEVMSAYRRHEGGLWWNSQSDLAKHWQAYGLQNVAMFLEMLKMHGDNEKLNVAISNSMATLFKTLLKIDKKLAEDVLTRIYKESPVALTNLVVNQQKELEEKTILLAGEEQKVEVATTEILSLRTDVYQLRDEIQSLKNARLLGRIIKLRDTIGELRKFIISAPRRTAHKTRVVVAPFVPRVLRKKLKAIYRQARGIGSNPNIETVVNKPWLQTKPLVSVVIPYFNRVDTIDDTLQSLESQTFVNFETLVIDDGSTDPDSIDKLKQLKNHPLKLTIVHQPNQGVSAARNNGIGRAKGKYVICLDSDDMLDATFIEKAVMLLETQPDVAIATSWMSVFGVKKENYKNLPYDPLQLYKNNMVTTAAAFRKEAWEATGGYKRDIGYEDWEYWLNLAEKGFWGRLIPEPLFRYRTAMQSRYVDDKDVHWNNLKRIQNLHPKYAASVKHLQSQRRSLKRVAEIDTAFINLSSPKAFIIAKNDKPNVLITIPWMTFGGAETLIYNFCREVKDDINITYVTGLSSENEWEYKFKEITPNVYHLANIFDDEILYLEFIANYIKTRDIDLLHIIHNGFTFKMLPELKRRFPKLKVAVTLFNDRVEYFEQSIDYDEYIDSYISDNDKVAKHYRQRLDSASNISVVPNGIDCYEEFSPSLFNREKERAELGLQDNELGVFFVGRISEEKNPDVFIDVATELLKFRGNSKLKFFIIGDGPMRGKVEHLISKADSPNINYLGYQAEVARYLSAADIFVLPSSIEGFPLSILEAMAMRVAIVASDVGAVAEVVENGKEGIIVTAGSAEEIVEAVSALSKDSARLANMKQNARKKVENQYSNRTLGSNYKKLYKRLIE